jgi:hypothetical protein
VRLAVQERRVQGGLAAGERPPHGVLEGQQRISGLAGPLGTGRRAVLAGPGQLTQHVSVSQGMTGHPGVGVIRRPRIVTGDPAKPGSTPAASIPSVPRLGCTVISENSSVEAECTQASLPATRSPVSSKCATGAAVIASRPLSSTGPTAPPMRR